MSQLITIACPSDWKLASFAKFLEALAQQDSADFSAFDNQLQVVASDGRWKLIANEVLDTEAAAEDYASNEDLDGRFRREAGLLRFFTIIFDDIGVVRRVLRTITQEAVDRVESVWIDTDYGWVIDAQRFLKEMERDAGWDWRVRREEK